MMITRGDLNGKSSSEDYNITIKEAFDAYIDKFGGILYFLLDKYTDEEAIEVIQECIRTNIPIDFGDDFDPENDY